jgi:hypothetical protein
MTMARAGTRFLSMLILAALDTEIGHSGDAPIGVTGGGGFIGPWLMERPLIEIMPLG